jgi:hypothetical protein
MLLIFMILLAFVPQVLAEEDPAPLTIAYYHGDVHTCTFRAPENWKVDLDNANLDGMTAAMYPDSENYVDADMIIFIWVFKCDSLPFREFITADSAFYVNSGDGLEFTKIDSIINSRGNKWIILETADPGAKQTVCLVGYLDAEAEIVIYELNISDRIFYAEGESNFREALASFSFLEDE